MIKVCRIFQIKPKYFMFKLAQWLSSHNKKSIRLQTSTILLCFLLERKQGIQSITMNFFTIMLISPLFFFFKRNSKRKSYTPESQLWLPQFVQSFSLPDQPITWHEQQQQLQELLQLQLSSVKSGTQHSSGRWSP